MVERTAGKRKPAGYRSASTKPEVARRIQDWWTPERREAKRQEVLERNPHARYHGLSAKRAKQIRDEAGRCAHCGATERLHIHHKDRDKRNQDPANLVVLCKRCHSREHRGEPRVRKTT